MRRALWSVPVAAMLWYVAGFGPWFFGSQDAMASWSERRLLPLDGSGADVVLVGGAVGGVVAGLVVRRLRLAVPLTVALGIGLWMLARKVQIYRTGAPSYHEQRVMLFALLVATGLAAIVGALGSRRSVAAAVAAALPVASYALLPGTHTAGQPWLTELNGVMIAIGFALLLYIACWRSGWPAVTSWPLVAASYLVAFALIATAADVARAFSDGHRGRDVIANVATDAFVRAFRPFAETYWPWLAVAVFLGVMIVALKIRAVPPAEPVVPYDPRPNDAFIPDDLDWIDRPEPRRRLIPRRNAA